MSKRVKLTVVFIAILLVIAITCISLLVVSNQISDSQDIVFHNSTDIKAISPRAAGTSVTSENKIVGYGYNGTTNGSSLHHKVAKSTYTTYTAVSNFQSNTGGTSYPYVALAGSSNNYYFDTQSNLSTFSSSSLIGNMFFVTSESGAATSNYGAYNDSLGGVLFTGCPSPSQYSTMIGATFELSQELINVLSDNLLKVDIKPYFILDNVIEFQARIGVVRYRYEPSKGLATSAQVYASSRSTRSNNSTNPLSEQASNLSSGEWSNDSFIQVFLYDFNFPTGVQFVIKEIGFEVTIQPNESTTLLESDITTTVESKKFRNTNVSGLYVSVGDIVNLDVPVVIGAGTYDLDQNKYPLVNGALFHYYYSSGKKTYMLDSVFPETIDTYLTKDTNSFRNGYSHNTDVYKIDGNTLTVYSNSGNDSTNYTVTDYATLDNLPTSNTNVDIYIRYTGASNIQNGTMFRYLFLLGTDETIIKWTPEEGNVTISEDNEDFSGANIEFTVIGSSTGKIIFNGLIAYRTPDRSSNQLETDLIAGNVDAEFTLDEDSPNTPTFNNNTFYTKYINNKDYYIDANAEVKNSDNITDRLNLNHTNTTTLTRPNLTNDSITTTGTGQITYYKTQYVGTTIPTKTSAQISTGFTLTGTNDAFTLEGGVEPGVSFGEYCEVGEGGIITYSNMYLNLYTYKYGSIYEYVGKNQKFNEISYTTVNSVDAISTTGYYLIDDYLYYYNSHDAELYTLGLVSSTTDENSLNASNTKTLYYYNGTEFESFNYIETTTLNGRLVANSYYLYLGESDQYICGYIYYVDDKYNIIPKGTANMITYQLFTKNTLWYYNGKNYIGVNTTETDNMLTANIAGNYYKYTGTINFDNSHLYYYDGTGITAYSYDELTSVPTDGIAQGYYKYSDTYYYSNGTTVSPQATRNASNIPYMATRGTGYYVYTGTALTSGHMYKFNGSGYNEISYDSYSTFYNHSFSSGTYHMYTGNSAEYAYYLGETLGYQYYSAEKTTIDSISAISSPAYYIFQNQAYVLYLNDSYIKTSGVWSIELVTYDYVGNSNYCSTKYFIRVDISEYNVQIQYILGKSVSDTSKGVVSKESAILTYATINDAGTISPYVALKNTGEAYEAYVRRGQYISLKLKYASPTYYNTYILTKFSTTGVSFDTTDLTYSNSYDTIIAVSSNQFSNATVNYAFFCSEAFCKTEASRTLKLYFKLKVNVRCSNLTQTYTGASREVKNAVYSMNGDLLPSISATTHYYTDEGRTNEIAKPYNAGTYYFKSEVINNQYYYGFKYDVLTVKQATPVINSLVNTINVENCVVPYGQSLATIDFDSSLSPDSMNSGLYIYYEDREKGIYATTPSLSTDGILGYYSIQTPTKTSASYLLPSAGTLELTIVFTPCVGTWTTNAGGGIIASYENNEFIRDNNYETAIQDVVITIEHDISTNFTINESEDYSVKIVDIETLLEAKDPSVYYLYVGEKAEGFKKNEVYTYSANNGYSQLTKRTITDVSNVSVEGYVYEYLGQSYIKNNIYYYDGSTLTLANDTLESVVEVSTMANACYLSNHIYYYNGIRYSDIEYTLIESGTIGSVSEAGFYYDGADFYYHDGSSYSSYYITTVNNMAQAVNQAYYIYSGSQYYKYIGYTVEHNGIYLYHNNDLVELDPIKVALIIDTEYDGNYVELDIGVESASLIEAGLDLSNYVNYSFIDITDIQVDPSTLAFKDEVPITAGLYYVRGVIDESLCNYAGTQYYLLYIKKITLEVSVTNVSCEYQYEQNPIVSASLDGTSYTSRVAFGYTYYYYNESYGNSLQQMAVDENLVPSSELRRYTNTPYLSGNYVAYCYVNDDNYQGYAYGILTINRVNDNTYTSITWPTLETSKVAAGYNLYCGQPLAEANISSTWSVSYTYVTYTSATRKISSVVSVPGEMVLVYAKYQVWIDGLKEQGIDTSNLTEETYIEYMKAYADAAFDEHGYDWFICFVANDRENFALMYTEVPVYIGKAIVDWSKVEIEDITYEKKVNNINDISISKNLAVLYTSKLSFDTNVYTKENGVYTYSNTISTDNDYYVIYGTRASVTTGESIPANTYYENIDGILSITADTIFIEGKRYYTIIEYLAYLSVEVDTHYNSTLNTREYYIVGNSIYLLIDNSTNDYSYSLNLAASITPNAGSRYLSVNALFSDANFASSYVNSCLLVINQKELTITFDYNSTTTFTSVYKTFNYGDLYNFISYSGNTLEFPSSLTGTFTYVDNAETKEISNNLSVGTYIVTYTLVNTNYCGSVTFTLEIAKSALTVTTRPAIANLDYVRYGNLKRGVSFYNGAMRGANGERVAGTFEIYLTDLDATFGNAGLIDVLYFKFTPQDTNNYETFIGTRENNGFVNQEIYKANISSLMNFVVTTTSDTTYTATYGVYSNYANESQLIATYLESGFTTFSIIDTNNIYVNDEISASTLAWHMAITYANGGADVPANLLNVGSYRLTITISKDVANFEGSCSILLNIEKKGAYVGFALSESGNIYELNGVTGVKKQYTARSQTISTVVYSVDGDILSGEAVRFEYRYNGARIEGLPLAIGYYAATAVLNSTNYKLVDNAIDQNDISAFNTFLMIGVNRSEITLSNYTQKYTVQKEIKVTLGSNEAQYTMYYKGQDDSIYEDLPINAGTYDIYLVFEADDNNGYSEEICAKDINSVYVLTIGKYTANIIVNSTINIVYSGQQKTAFTAYTEPYGLLLTYSYSLTNDKASAIPTTITELGALDANTYYVFIDVEDDNYEGTVTVTYKVNKAPLNITTIPTFGSYVYNTDIAPTETGATPGKVYCVYDNTNPTGVFSIDINDMKSLNAGVHVVRYTFYPDSNNYETVSSTTSITIEKQVFNEDYIYLSELDGKSLENNAYYLENSDYIIEYNNLRHNFTVAFDESKVYEYTTLNNDFDISLTYNNMSNRPLSLGTYTIIAKVTSKNYECTKTWAYKLVITKCTPVITVLPNVINTFTIGDSITTSDISGGRAVIRDTGTTINGVFTISEGSVVFNKANSNTVEITFTPNETETYNTITSSLVINVVGKDIFDVDDVSLVSGSTVNGSNITGTTNGVSKKLTTAFSTIYDGGAVVIKIYPANGSGSLTYGVNLEDFKLEFVPYDSSEESANLVELLNAIGMLEFVKDSSYIPNVGENLQITYKLIANASYTANETNYEYYDSTYNNMNIYVSLNGIVDKADLISLGADIDVMLIGTDVASASITNTILNITLNNEILASFDYRVVGDEILQGLILDTDTVLTATFSINAGILNVSTTNYFISDYAVTINAYNEIDSRYINVANTSKQYNGAKIDIADLGVSVTNTDKAITPGSYELMIYDSNNELSDGIAIGTYTIFIYINDTINNYYGVKEVEFTVEKRDVSEEIALNKQGDVFGSSTINILRVLVNGSQLNTSYYTLKYKRSTDSIYTNNITFNAGVYDVLINVSSPEFEGTAVRQYTINPKSITLVTRQSTYSYTYGSSISAPSIYFTETESGETISLEYTMYYYSNNYTRSTQLPENADEYTVYVELANTNYVLVKSSFALTINPRATSITQLPSLLVNSSGYVLTYGQKLSELGFAVNTGVGKYGDSVISGTFGVLPNDANNVLNAGTQTINICFTPTDTNYATSQTTMEIVVGKQVASITFTNLVTAYTGTNRYNELTYTITPSIDVSFTFTSTLTGTTTATPINAGNYYINSIPGNPNYTISYSTTSTGLNPVFTINKAKVSNVIIPTTSAIGVGENIGKSTLSNGFVYYEGFTNAISGTFSFVQSALVFQSAGTKTVEFRFTPNVSSNFVTYTGTTTIVINKAVATITISNNSITYGDKVDISKVVFKTNPQDLTVKYDLTYDGKTYRENELIPAGTYYFTCWVEDDNYTSGNVEFVYIVNRKVIDIDFINASGQVVTSYSTTYRTAISVGVKMYDSNYTENAYYLVEDEREVYAAVSYLYTNRTGTDEYSSINPPMSVGSYDLTVTVSSANYYATKTVIYRISIGVVEKIEFDYETLTEQVYGQVVPPVVVTTPSNVSYYIVYQGYDTELPKTVGSYNITVYINDPNFETTQISAVFKINARNITITDIKSSDKAYDGTTAVDITAKLQGLVFSDEVYLTLEAKTADDSPAIGTHYVAISKCEITGLSTNNYILTVPEYNGRIKISGNVVKDETSSSYIINNAGGFDDGTEVTFYSVDTTKNKSSFLTKLIGVQSDVVAFSLTVNGVSVVNDNLYKVCVEIPKEYLDKEFDVKFGGELEGETISYTREGNYLTFYTSSSTGQVAFEVSEFRYTYVVVAGVLIIVLIAIIVLLILNPIYKRRHNMSPAYEKAAIRYIKKTK